MFNAVFAVLQKNFRNDFRYFYLNVFYENKNRFFFVCNCIFHWKQITSKRKKWIETISWRNKFFSNFRCSFFKLNRLKRLKCWICRMIFFWNVLNDAFKWIANSWSFQNICILTTKLNRIWKILASFLNLMKKKTTKMNQFVFDHDERWFMNSESFDATFVNDL